MYLKNLTVLGFKSFADKTSLNFQPGVTAIVGPNGCGKSNVSDAIRWVLGEQSAKALRGGEMADVIFNGAEGRKAQGMAEVSLTIGGVDEENLRAGGVEVAYNEVTLTRRVFRDGGSEYFLNKTPCRLKDIQQLFMGTGVGRTSYSIMAQGNITQILSSKPEDRRMVFEEAAGITRFKAQKKEAMRKLESTDQNLLRVSDLIREVKRQIGSLQRQAGKARRYKQLMIELQHLDTQLARHQFDVVHGEIQARLQHVETLRLEMEQFSEKVLAGEKGVGHLREQLSSLEQEISHHQQRGLELRGEAERHEHRIQHQQERISELETQNSRALQEISEADERRLAAEGELLVIAGQLTQSGAAVEQLRKTLAERQQALAAEEKEIQQLQEQSRHEQAELFSSAQQLARIRNELNSLDLQKKGNAVRLEKLSSEKIQLEEERAKLESRLNEFSANVELEKQTAVTHRGTVAERQERLASLQQELNDLTGAIDKQLQEQAEKRSRLELLQQLQADYEGFGAGAATTLKTAENILGSLAEKIQVATEHLAPVEAALGQSLQLVLAEDPAVAEKIISDLREQKKGRVSVAALQLTSQRQGHHANGSAPPGRPLTEVIQAEPAVQSLVNSLAERFYLVPDLSIAVAAWRACKGNYEFVTSQGEVLNRHGIFSGGAQNGQQGSSSILSRKNQIRDLRADLTRLQEEVGGLSRNKGSVLAEQTSLNASLQEAQTELRSHEVRVATRQGEFNALENSQRLLHQKIETVIYEIQSLASQEEEGTRKRDGLSTQLTALEQREAALQEKLTGLNTSLESVRQRREQAAGALTETKVGLATQEQLLASFQAQKSPLERRIQELAGLASQRKSEITSFLDRKTQSEKDISQSRARIEVLQQERSSVNQQAAHLQEQKEAFQADIETREEQLREHRRQLHQAQEKRSGLEVELAEKKMSLQNLRERIFQKYQVNLDDVRSECITITYADEGSPKVETLTPEEMAASGASTDWTAVTEQVGQLQKKLDEMGPVNLVAIEEYEETEQRHQFLTTQNDDLTKAKEQLMELINRINSQTREMFNETFLKIRDNFRAMFTEIFGGGKADLILQDEGDALECGIEIVARPPGKQLQTISLLSGGEQTMTAVALLFSIYQVKPSPFCVLDELDAPLDESNINRFIRILQRFQVHSQFIIITHNKRTIGMADVLYGVTMEEQGISKIVSVKFHKADEAVTDHVPHSIERPSTVPAVVEEEDKLHTPAETMDVLVEK